MLVNIMLSECLILSLNITLKKPAKQNPPKPLNNISKEEALNRKQVNTDD